MMTGREKAIRDMVSNNQRVPPGDVAYICYLLDQKRAIAAAAGDRLITAHKEIAELKAKLAEVAPEPAKAEDTPKDEDVDPPSTRHVVLERHAAQMRLRNANTFHLKEAATKAWEQRRLYDR